MTKSLRLESLKLGSPQLESLKLENPQLKSKVRRVSLERPPFEQFVELYREVESLGIPEPNAMLLSTLSTGAQPSARVVLMKDLADERLTFFTNYNSQKSKDILAQPKVSVTFFWQSLAWQVRIEGLARKCSRERSEAYFKTRDRDKQIGAWASPQSQVIESYDAIQGAANELSQRFAGQEISCPDFWGGFDVFPESYEFWFGRTARLHERYCFVRESDGTTERWSSFIKAP